MIYCPVKVSKSAGSTSHGLEPLKTFNSNKPFALYKVDYLRCFVMATESLCVGQKMPARVRWRTGVEEWKLHLWEFWKKCVGLKWASVQHMQKISSLPSSHLSELPPGLFQEIPLKGSLFVHPFYTENAFVYIFNIWKQFSKIYREFSGSCPLDLQCLK